MLTHYLFYNNGIVNIKNRIKKKNSWKFLGISTVCCVVKNDSKKIDSMSCRKKMTQKKIEVYIYS